MSEQAAELVAAIAIGVALVMALLTLSIIAISVTVPASSRPHALRTFISGLRALLRLRSDEDDHDPDDPDRPG